MKLTRDTLVTLFIAFVIVNLLTMPLSPYGFSGGMMTKAQYAPIMVTKLVLAALFVIGFVYFGVSELVSRRRKPKVTFVADNSGSMKNSSIEFPKDI